MIFLFISIIFGLKVKVSGTICAPPVRHIPILTPNNTGAPVFLGGGFSSSFARLCVCVCVRASVYVCEYVFVCVSASTSFFPPLSLL